jgi:hypothetical protein
VQKTKTKPMEIVLIPLPHVKKKRLSFCEMDEEINDWTIGTVGKSYVYKGV